MGRRGWLRMGWLACSCLAWALGRAREGRGYAHDAASRQRRSRAGRPVATTGARHAWAWAGGGTRGPGMGSQQLVRARGGRLARAWCQRQAWARRGSGAGGWRESGAGGWLRVCGHVCACVCGQGCVRWRFAECPQSRTWQSQGLSSARSRTLGNLFCFFHF